MARKRMIPIETFHDEGAITHPYLIVSPMGARTIEVRVFGTAMVHGKTIRWNQVVTVPVAHEEEA